MATTIARQHTALPMSYYREMVKDMDMMDDIDLSFYNRQVDEAIEAISQFGDVERFLNIDIVDDVEDLLAPWEAADEPWEDSVTPFDVR